MGAVIDPGAARLDELAGGDHCRVTENGDRVTLTTRLHAQHAEPVFLVVERDPLDQASQYLGERVRLPCLRHPRIMEINDRRGYRVKKRSTANNGHSLDDHRAAQIEPTTAAQPSRRERLFLPPKPTLGPCGEINSQSC